MSDEKPSVSVIICARNEAENLKKFLPIILNQEYPDYEVVIVDDNSSDKTYEILLQFQKKYPILHIVNIREKKHYGKKTALELGIQKSTHELLLLTDADCYPTSHFWIDRMQAEMRGNIEIGLGFSPYKKSYGFLNAFIRFETVIAAIQYFSFALFGQPYMGVGRNLIYRKSLFKRQGGFKSHEHIASGDDDLFINASASFSNIKVILDSQTFVYSIPKSSWLKFYYQKSRHLTTGKKYKPLHQLMLGGFSASHFLHYVIGFAMLLSNDWVTVVFAAYFLRMLIATVLLWFILKRLEQKDLIYWFLILDVAFVPYYKIFGLSMIFGNTNKW